MPTVINSIVSLDAIFLDFESMEVITQLWIHGMCFHDFEVLGIQLNVVKIAAIGIQFFPYSVD
jgi:hypothetical protein